MHPYSPLESSRSELSEPERSVAERAVDENYVDYPHYPSPTCIRTRKFGSRSEPNFPSQKLSRLPPLPVPNVHPHSQVWFAKRTKLSEPKIMPITPITRDPTCTRLKSLVREANQTFRAIVRVPLLPVIRFANRMKRTCVIFLFSSVLCFRIPLRATKVASGIQRSLDSQVWFAKRTKLSEQLYNLSWITRVSPRPAGISDLKKAKN